MKIFISTLVSSDFENVAKKFNRDLFLKLTNPLAILKIKRFDGCSKNDEIHLELKVFNKSIEWVSVITASEKTKNEYYFIDEGRDLPFPLTYWKHTHFIKKETESETFIIDEIEFRAKTTLLEKAIYPILYSVFLLRKPIYQKEFK